MKKDKGVVEPKLYQGTPKDAEKDFKIQMDMYVGRGGKRAGAGRKAIPAEDKKVPVKFYIKLKDRKKVKDFIKTLE